MKAPLSWLKDYVAITVHPSELAERLTMAGLEANITKSTGGDWDNIIVGQVTAIDPHPNADRLRLATVNLGTEQQTVVCGAPNIRIGDKIVFAHVGAQLIDAYSGQVLRLKSAKIRGVTSSGMVCSEKELGISDNHEGIMVLPADAPPGTPLADYLGDVIFDLEVTPNRPDCLSVIGIAREVAALTREGLCLPEVEYREGGTPIEEHIAVEITAPELCPRYCASMITGVKLTESPAWMQQRLLACGMRPINNIVDITNYVMLEHGQPLHAFDSTKIRGKKIIVRRADEGEKIVSLDGVERVLSHDMLVIADTEGAVAVAGVMGGANSEVSEDTTSILLEAANFNPASIHYTGRILSLPSEACRRFERGIRPELAIEGLKRATRLIVQLAGGEAASGVIDVFPGKQDSKLIPLPTAEIKRILGIEFSCEHIIDVLNSLGFNCRAASASEVLVTAPYWRSDIRLTVDLIEEVARITGYDQIPETTLSQSIPAQNPAHMLVLKDKIRQSLTGFGFQEILTYSLTSLQALKKLLPEPHPLEPTVLRLSNPMTADQEYLRPNLRANLLIALSENRKHEDGGIRLFELGKVYRSRSQDLPDEPELLCGVLSGPRAEKSWHGWGEQVDFFDAKGVIESLLKQLAADASFETSSDESLHPGKQVAIVISGNRLGVIGEIHPKVLQAFDISETAYMFEIDLATLLPFTIAHHMFQPISRFPAITRDMALVIDSHVTHEQVQGVIVDFPLVSHVTLFDVYSGEQVPPGKKSLAYNITFQSASHTLTDEEVDQVQQQILGRLSKELGATLRS